MIRHRQILGFSHQDLQKLPQKFGTDNCSTWLMKEVCKSVSSRRIGLVCRFCWNDSGLSVFCVTTIKMFSQSLSLGNFYEILSTTQNLCEFWCSIFQQVSTYGFCSWDDIFTQKWKCCSHKSLSKRTESLSTLSTNNSIERNFYLSCSNHIVTSLRLEKNVGGFSKHQDTSSDTNRNKACF